LERVTELERERERARLLAGELDRGGFEGKWYMCKRRNCCCLFSLFTSGNVGGEEEGSPQRTVPRVRVSCRAVSGVLSTCQGGLSDPKRFSGRWIRIQQRNCFSGPESRVSLSGPIKPPSRFRMAHFLQGISYFCFFSVLELGGTHYVGFLVQNFAFELDHS
jgi:hypothetical protein